MKVNYTQDRCRVMVNQRNLQSISMKVILWIINLMEKVKKYTKMEEYMKENLEMEKNKVQVC